MYIQTKAIKIRTILHYIIWNEIKRNIIIIAIVLDYEYSQMLD